MCPIQALRALSVMETDCVVSKNQLEPRSRLLSSGRLPLRNAPQPPPFSSRFTSSSQHHKSLSSLWPPAVQSWMHHRILRVLSPSLCMSISVSSSGLACAISLTFYAHPHTASRQCEWSPSPDSIFINHTNLHMYVPNTTCKTSFTFANSVGL